VTDVLDRLVDDSIQLWVPLVEKFYEGSLDSVSHGDGYKKRFEVAMGDAVQGVSPRAVHFSDLSVQKSLSGNEFV